MISNVHKFLWKKTTWIFVIYYNTYCTRDWPNMFSKFVVQAIYGGNWYVWKLAVGKVRTNPNIIAVKLLYQYSCWYFFIKAFMKTFLDMHANCLLCSASQKIISKLNKLFLQCSKYSWFCGSLFKYTVIIYPSIVVNLAAVCHCPSITL